MQPKCVHFFLPTVKAIDSQAKLWQLLSIVDFAIDSSLLLHQLAIYVDH